MRSDLIVAMHIYIPEQTVTLAKLQEPFKHGKRNNNKELSVYWSSEQVVNSPGYRLKETWKNVNCSSKTTLRGQSTQYYTDANDRLTCKVLKSMSLFLLFFYVSTLNLFCFIGNMQRMNWMYFCINNVLIWLTKYQNDIICNKIQLQG